MRDVAEMADVSITTVSHVINRTRPVSEKLSNKVQKAMKDLDYYPNRLASSLRKKTSCYFGLIVPNNSNPFYAEVTRGVEDICFGHNYNVILCNSNRSLEREIAYTKLLISKQVDGILFVGAWIGNQYDHLKEARKQGIPVVIVDRFAPGMDLDQVITDNELGGWLATSNLIGLGHKNIACIS